MAHDLVADDKNGKKFLDTDIQTLFLWVRILGPPFFGVNNSTKKYMVIEMT